MLISYLSLPSTYLIALFKYKCVSLVVHAHLNDINPRNILFLFTIQLKYHSLSHLPAFQASNLITVAKTK